MNSFYSLSSLQPFYGMNFHVVVFGCQMNKHDAERVSGMLESLGALEVSSIEESDIVVFLTCCVREAADERLYGQVSSIKNIPVREGSPLTKRIISIGGCIGQRDGQSLVDTMSHVDVVFGTHNVGALPRLIIESLNSTHSQVEVRDSSEEFSTDLPSHREKEWSAWLPITIGCNNFCTYCIVPYVRGREKSRPFESIVEEAVRYAEQGVAELTLLGQNVNSYGRDLYGEPRFAELLQELSTVGIPRLRFATSHPKDLSDKVIEQFATSSTLMPALHLPVQSGSNRILKEMNRRYTKEYYWKLIRKLRAANPSIAFSTDIIVGFPGETEQDFLDTAQLVDEVAYHQVFSFIYSKRAGTPAATMSENASSEEIHDRFNRLLKIIEKNAYELNQKDNNTKVPILFEGVSKKDKLVLSGKSPKNQTVHVKLPDGTVANDYLGKILPVRITETKTWYLRGSLL